MDHVNQLLAWAAQTSEKAPDTAQQPPNIMPLIIGFIVVFLLFQLLVSGPKQKAEAKKRQEALNTLGKGDTVLTNSGIYGTVDSVEKDKNIINVTIAPKVTVRVASSAISSYTKKDKGGSAEEAA